MQPTRCDPKARWAPRLAVIAGLATTFATSHVHAQVPPDPVEEPHSAATPPRYRVFVYERAAEKNFFRLTLEEIAILAAGSIEYFQNRNANEGDWDLQFSADSFESKVAGRAVSFDANKFGTNWILHPLGGWMYYGAARGNRLGPFQSLFVATMSSAIWEWVGEYREQASINDLIATPLGGMSLSEPMLQLGAWFERGRPTFGNKLMATLLAPTKRVHDALDDMDPLRAPDVERGELDARLYVAAGPVWQTRTNSSETDISLGLRTHLFYAPSPHEPGSTHAWLDDGNLSSIRLEGTMGDQRLIDARFATRVSLIGHYSKDVVLDGGRPRGHAMYLGLGTGIDYQWHEYDRTARRVQDEIAMVEVLGSTLENWHVLGPLKVHSSMALSFDFAGVGSLARDERVALRGDNSLPTVVKTEGYAHAFGGTIAPHLAVSLPHLTVFGEARLDAFRSVVDRDRYFTKYSPNTSGADERFIATAGVTRTLFENVDLAFKLTRLFRRSRLEDITQSFGETSVRIEAALRL